MENVKEFILSNNLFKAGDVIGVGVSGGKDSMALLHYLNSIANELEFEVVALTIDHSIRENSHYDVMHVMDFCRKNKIRAYKFKIDVPRLAKENKQSLETAARKARYQIFESMVKKNIVDKIATAHHKQDQAESILMHIFRGCGLSGLRGMSAVRDEIFVRPMLEVDVKDIWKYLFDNDIEIVEDETNKENEYARNLLRNEIMPLISSKWGNVVENILSLADIAKQDDDFIKQNLPLDGLIAFDKEVKIPQSYFLYDSSLIARIIIKALEMIGVTKDFESKHIDIIQEFANNAENGKKLNLPNLVEVHKEYDFITITNKVVKKVFFFENFKTGTIVVPNFGKIAVKGVKEMQNDGALYFDAKLVPENAEWRYREEGDVFEKFGGGTKKLKSYLTNIKYPARLRDTLPVLAVGNEILIIPGVEISNKIKITENTKRIQRLEVKS